MHFLARALCLFAMLLAKPAFAQASADLSLEVDVIPAGPLRPGLVAQLVLTFHNHGPADIVGAGAVSSDYPFLTGGYFDLFPVKPQPCTLYFDDFVGPPGEPSFLIASALVGNIPAGGSRVCTLGLFVYPEATGTFELSFRADSGTPDDNPANDVVLLPLTFAEPPPRPIPTGNPWALLALAGAMLAFAPRRYGSTRHLSRLARPRRRG